MSLKQFKNNILKYDIINKFIFTHSKKLPKLKKACINFSCKNNSSKILANSLLAIELISKQKGILTKSKKPNLSYKIRENSPVGCKVTLRKQNLNKFILFFINKVFPNSKNFSGILLNKKLKNFITYELDNLFIFPEIEKNYGQFKNLSTLKNTFVFKCINNLELKFLVKSLQFITK